MYLCALAISDITIISTSFFLFFAESMRKRSAVISKYFALSAPIMFPLGLTAQTCSVFLTVTAAFDCFILIIASDAVKHKFCSTRTSGWIITGVVIGACTFNLPHLFEVYVVNCWSVPFTSPNYDVCPTALRQNEVYAIIYYAYGYTIIMALGPVLLLLILNTAIVLIMRQTCAGVSDRNSNQGGSDITTLVLVVCLFIACNILPLTVNFLELLLNLVNSYLIDFSNLMVVLNSSCNFLIYYAFGSQFRRTLKEYCSQYLWREQKKLKYAGVALDCGHCKCSRCCSNSASKHSLIDTATSVGASPAPMRV
ncbi:Protein FRPR-1 [Aphelenchoides avenae]|nr:Protein FRPR-1 [Aphelenchus avenae]